MIQHEHKVDSLVLVRGQQVRVVELVPLMGRNTTPLYKVNDGQRTFTVPESSVAKRVTLG